MYGVTMYMIGLLRLSAVAHVSDGICGCAGDDLLLLAGCSTAMSSSRRTLSWESSLSNLISRRAVIGN